MVLLALALGLEPSLPVRVDGPQFACREFIFGPELTQPGGIWLQLAYQNHSEVKYDGNSVSGNSDTFQNYGFGSVEVVEGSYAGEPCRVVKWKSVYRPPRKGIEDQRTCFWYVRADGTLLRCSEIVLGVRDDRPYGPRSATITFGAESATVQRVTEKDRRSFEVPYQGREDAVLNIFKPIYVGGKVTTYEKKISWLDPFTAKWQDWTILHRSKWNGTYNQRVVGGEAFNFETPGGYFSTYLTAAGSVFDVRFNDKFRYIPDEVTVNKKFK